MDDIQKLRCMYDELDKVLKQQTKPHKWFEETPKAKFRRMRLALTEIMLRIERDWDNIGLVK